MNVLVDGDLIVYRIGFAMQEEDQPLCSYYVDKLVDEITENCKADKREIYITSSDKSNFRYKIYPEYKANRKDVPKPIHYDFIREYLVSAYDATVVFEQEADDAIGIKATELKKDFVIASIDKDLKQIPGTHYNFVKKFFYEIDDIYGKQFFYRQLLSGDDSDNIPGCPGIGNIKAYNMLRGYEWESDMFLECCNVYRSSYPKERSVGEIFEELQRNAQLLYIRRVRREIWSPPFDPSLTVKNGTFEVKIRDTYSHL